MNLSREMLASEMGDRWSAREIEHAVELLARGGGRFPYGTRSLPEQLVREIQRARLLAAMSKAVAELGYRAVTVQDVLDRAGVSRPTFYEHFANKEDCFLLAFDAVATRFLNGLEAAASEGGDDWHDRLLVGMEELLRFVVADPDAARTLIVESRAAGPTALLRRDELLDALAGWIDAQVRDELPEPPSSVAAAGIAGGIDALLYSRLNRGETDLLSLLPSLMHFVERSAQSSPALTSMRPSTGPRRAHP